MRFGNGNRVTYPPKSSIIGSLSEVFPRGNMIWYILKVGISPEIFHFTFGSAALGVEEYMKCEEFVDSSITRQCIASLSFSWSGVQHG